VRILHLELLSLTYMTKISGSSIDFPLRFSWFTMSQQQSLNNGSQAAKSVSAGGNIGSFQERDVNNKPVHSVVTDMPVAPFATRVDEHTFIYRVAGTSTESSLFDFISEKLKLDRGYCDVLCQCLSKMGINLWKLRAPELYEVILDTNSADKWPSELSEYYEGGLADPIPAIHVAVEAIRLAIEVDLDLTSHEFEEPQAKGARIKQEALDKGLADGTSMLLEKLTSARIVFGNAKSGLDMRTGYLGVIDAYRYARLVAHWSPVSAEKHPQLLAFGTLTGQKPEV